MANVAQPAVPAVHRPDAQGERHTARTTVYTAMLLSDSHAESGESGQRRVESILNHDGPTAMDRNTTGTTVVHSLRFQLVKKI